MTDTCVYNPDTDDLKFSELIKIGEVINKNGCRDILELDEDNKDKRRRMSVLSIDTVFSGRGPFDVWKSNLQKMIRRNKPREALKSVIEIAEMGGHFLSNILGRLCIVIISEDIGCAQSKLVSKALRLRTFYDLNKNKYKEKIDTELKNQIMELVYNMAISKKSRLVDNMLCYAKWKGTKLKKDGLKFLEIYLENEEKNVILRLKNCARACINYFNSDTANAIEQDDKKDFFPFLKRKKKKIYKLWNYILKHTPEEIFEINKNLYEIFECAHGGGETILNIIHACYNIIFYGLGKLNLEFKMKKCPYTWKEIKKDNSIWPADISYDKHTKIGKKLGRGVPFFFRYGAKLGKIQKGLKEYEEIVYNLVANF
jgi:hypothetical protein